MLLAPFPVGEDESITLVGIILLDRLGQAFLEIFVELCFLRLQLRDQVLFVLLMLLRFLLKACFCSPAFLLGHGWGVLLK